jgi:hypothetical protein
MRGARELWERTEAGGLASKPYRAATLSLGSPRARSAAPTLYP